eukprot:g129.t1
MANRVMPSGVLMPVAKSELQIGMLLQVNEGDVVPTDAVIRSGEGLLDESMLTGESTPVSREEGQEVIGGSTLLSGSLQVEVSAVGKNTVLEQMVELVKTAQQDKPPIQQLADKISAIFVPAVLLISLLTFLLSYFVFDVSSGQSLMRAIAVLVISCPCAMGLATPTAVMVGVGRLARLGVLIKGGRTVEQLASIKQLVFDKTGTLTTGAFRIEKAEYPSGEMKLANALIWEMERHSSHPIAQSIRTALEGMPKATAIPALEVKEERGIGMVAEGDDGHTYRFGSRRLLDSDADCEGDIFLLKDKEIMAVFRLGDDLKKGIQPALAALEEQGVESYILSGDQQAKTQRVAETLGVEHYFAEQLPAQKLEKIRELSADGPTAMVGDGINDAPALAQADLGISLSDASQVAIQSAKVVLLNGRIDVLPEAFGIAKHTMGYLYYGNYAQYYEIGRTEMIRSLGLSYKAMEAEHSVMMPVMSLQCRYVRPARYDEEITIRTTLRHLPDRTITFHMELLNEAGKLVNGGTVKLCFVDSVSDLGVQIVRDKWVWAVLAKDITTTFNAWSFSFTEEEKDILELTNNEVPINSVEITRPQLILGGARTFKFNDKGVERGSKPSSVYLNWDGAAIGSQQRNRKEVEIPAIGDFKVTEVVPQSGSEAMVDILFSDPLDENQDFNGLLDPKAFYQVRIGFRRSHSLFTCGEETSFDFVKDYYGSEDASLLNNWYGIEGYYREYRWDQRDDPCFPAYYNSDRFVYRTIMSSNLGLLVKGEGDNNYRAVVTNLQTTQAVAGAKVVFYSYQQQELATATTDEAGQAVVDLPEKAFFLVASSGEDQNYLRLEDNEALSTTRFDVAGTQVQDGLKGFLYGERGVWRPGDSVYLNFVLEDELGTLPPNYPVRFELRDTRGQLVETRTGVLPTEQIYPLHFRTQADAATGLWQATVVAGDATFRQNIRIETVKPNRIKVALETGGEVLRLGNGSQRIGLTANWLHGAPAANLTANVEASIRADQSGFESFADYTFIDRTKPTELVRSQVLFDGPLDAQGKANFTLSLPSANQAPGPLQVRLKNRVFERGGNFSTEFRNLSLHPFDFYAGLQIPRNRYGSPQLTVGEKTSIGLAAANYQGKAAANRKLKVSLHRVEWRWWWDDEDGNGGRYARDRSKEEIASSTVTSNAQGRASWEVEIERWGRYLITVCDAETQHCSSGYVYAGSPWYNEGTFSEEASMLTFQANKDDYAVGEDITITFPAGGAGRALLSLETGDGVLEEIWLDTKPGDNTYTFKASPEMAPTVYAFLTVLQPYAQDDNDLPIRAYGVIPLQVEDPATRLNPQLKVAAELKPEQSFTVEVSEQAGKAMTYTLAVVDEGLLSLTNFNTPNPHDAFYAREALGVKTWDLYNYILGKENITAEQILTIGGDAEGGGPKEASRANRFDPVVMHLGPFKLDRRGKAQHQLKMPNYIGAVRVMVVAAGGQAYGAAEKSVPVRKPLMVLATLPRVLGVGDEIAVPVNVFAMKDDIGEVTIRLSESSGLARVSTSSKTLRFSAMGDDIVYFPVEIGENMGIAKFTVVAEGGANDLTRSLKTDIDAYRELDYTYGSQLRDRAMMLQALLIVGKNDQADILARALYGEAVGASDKFFSYQCTTDAFGSCLIGAAAFLKFK